MEFHPKNLPWIENGILEKAEPVMYWHDANQSYEVWQGGKCVALCANDLPNMQQWWNWVMVTIFKLPDHEKAAEPTKPGDTVNHPAHYNSGKIEVIEALEDWKLEPHEWNAVKYVARAMHKGRRIEDLEKAIWYLRRKIALLKGDAPRPNAMPQRRA